MIDKKVQGLSKRSGMSRLKSAVDPFRVDKCYGSGTAPEVMAIIRNM